MSRKLVEIVPFAKFHTGEWLQGRELSGEDGMIRVASAQPCFRRVARRSRSASSKTIPEPKTNKERRQNEAAEKVWKGRFAKNIKRRR